MPRFLRRHKSAELLSSTLSSNELSKKTGNPSFRLPKWIRKEWDKSREESKIWRSTSKSKRRAKMDGAHGALSPAISEPQAQDVASTWEALARRSIDADLDTPSSKHGQRRLSVFARMKLHKHTSPFDPPMRYASLNRNPSRQDTPTIDAQQSTPSESTVPRRAKTVSGRIQSLKSRTGSVSPAISTSPYQAVSSTATGDSRLMLAAASSPNDDDKPRLSYDAHEDGDTRTRSSQLFQATRLKTSSARAVRISRPKDSMELNRQSLRFRLPPQRAVVPRPKLTRISSANIPRPPMQGNPDIPALSVVEVKIPPDKKWKHSHKNYFPPGNASMPQKVVIQICDAYRKEVEGIGGSLENVNGMTL